MIEAVNLYQVTDSLRDKLVYIDEDKGRLNVLLNCNQESVNKVDEYTSGNDEQEFQLSLLQNVFDFIIDDKWELRLEDF